VYQALPEPWDHLDSLGPLVPPETLVSRVLRELTETLEHRDRLVPRATSGRQEVLESRDNQDLQDHRDFKDLRALLGQVGRKDQWEDQARKVHQVHQDSLATPEIPALQAHKVRRDLTERQDSQARPDRAVSLETLAQVDRQVH